jgi:3-deoxy-D-manno-octulosonate 8-phosphate phosphatase (KDO 8-P phosphatase)
LSRKNSASKQHVPLSRLKGIRLILLDVDGVLTDARIIFGSDGTEYKLFDAHDGYGITRGREHGLQFAVISGRSSKVTTLRMARLGVRDVYQNAMDKVSVYRKLVKRYRMTPDEVCFIGDDEFDLPLLRLVGFSAAPANALDPVKDEVDYVTTRNGGRGAVREVIDLILRAQRLI